MTQSAREPPKLGPKVRALRRRESLSQVQLAERLGISPSYLNLIESNRRPLPATLLIKLAQLFGTDLHAFGADDDARLVSDLLEVFSDPLFDAYQLTSTDLRDLALDHPQMARAMMALYTSYKTQRGASEELASRLDGEEASGPDQSLLPSEEVSDLIQSRMNYFPELEESAEELWKKGRLDPEELYPGLVRYLDKQHGVLVRIARGEAERGVLRRFDTEKRILTLSELLPTRSRTFQIAHQIALLTDHGRIDRIAADAHLTTDESRGLARVALANYFAGAVLMPYTRFLEACREERYDLDVIGRRFRVGFEQLCHRYTTLRRPGAEGVPFHMIRIDVAGNISKRFSSSGIRFARFSGRLPALECLRGLHDPRHDPHPGLAIHRRRGLLLPREDHPQGLARLPRAAAGPVDRPRLPRRARARDGVLGRHRLRERPDRDAGRGDVPTLRAQRLRAAGVSIDPTSAPGRRERAGALSLRARPPARREVASTPTACVVMSLDADGEERRR